jgi:hypothetical protein
MSTPEAMALGANVCLNMCRPVMWVPFWILMPAADASGIYLFRLNAGGISLWQKAIYMK